MNGNKKGNTILLSIILFLIGVNTIFSHGLPIDINIPGLSYQGQLTPNEDFSLNFLQNIQFKITTDVFFETAMLILSSRILYTSSISR